MKTIPARTIGISILLAISLSVSSTGQAQTTIIKANTTTMDTAADWGGTAPSLTTIGQFDATISSGDEAALTLGGNVSLNGLLFLGSLNGPVTVGADGNTLTLGNSGINMISANQSVTLNCGLTLASGLQVWQVVPGQTLTIGGTFTNKGAVVDFTSFFGALGTLGNVNGILGPWSQYGSGTSLEYATVSGGAVSAYAGGTAAATAAAVTDTTGTVNYDVAAVGAIPANASFNTLLYSGAAGTISGNFTANGLMNVAAVQLTISSGITIGSTGNLVANCPASAGASYFDFTGPFTGSGATLTLNIANASSIVDFGDGTAGAQFTNFSGLIELGNSIGTMKLRSDSPSGANVDKGMGNLTLDLGTGSVNLTSKGSQGGTPTYNIGSLIGGVNTSLHAADASGVSLVTYKVGNLNLNSEFDGTIGGGTGTIAVSKVGTGTWTLTHANTYGGVTTVSGGTLSTGAAGTLANGGAACSIGEASDTAPGLVLDGGTLQYASTNVAATSINRLFTLTTNGGGIDASGVSALTMAGNGGNPIVCPSNGPRTLTLTGTNTGSNTFAPVLVNPTSGATSLAKSGTGEWVLTGLDTYTGSTTVSNGTLALGVGGSIAGSTNIVVDNGAIFDVSALSSFSLASGQSLLGNGTVNGSVTADSGSSVYGDAGAAYGTNTFNNSLTMSSGSSCSLDVGTIHTGPNDLIAVDGTLTLNSTVFNLYAPSSSVSLDTSADYVLMTASSIAGGSTVVSSPTWGVNHTPLNAANFSVVINGNTVRLHYTTSTPPSGTGSANPSTVTRGQSTTLSVTATPGTFPIGSVVVDTTLIGGAPGQHLIEVGVSDVYTNTFTVGPGITPASLSLPVTIYDNEATPLSGGTSIALTIAPLSEVWGGGSVSDDNWSDAANWLSGVAPLNGDVLTFAGSRQPTPNMDNSYSINALIFSNTAASFVIGTANSSILTLTGGVTNDSANTETLNVPISLSAAETFNAASGNLAISGVVSDSGGGLVDAGTNMLVLSGTNTYTGSTAIGGTLEIGGSGQLGSGAYGANITDSGTLIYNSTAAQALSGGISGAGTLAVDAGTLTLGGANSYGGGTFVNNSASLVFSAGQAIPATGTLTLNNTASVTVEPASQLPNVAVNGTNSITGNGNSGTGINVLNLAGTLNLSVSGGSGVFDLAGPVTGSGNVVLVATPTLRFFGTTGSSGLILNLGTTTSEASVRNSATAIALGGLIGGSSTILAGNNSGGSFMTYTIGGAGSNTEFDGAINDGSTGIGSTAVTKVGTNILTLGGTCSYNGQTTVSNGTLVVTGSLDGTNTVTVSGGTLGGSAVDIAGAITVQSGGTLAPGAGNTPFPATLFIDNNLTLLAGGTNIMRVSHTSQSSDLIYIVGTNTFGGTLTVLTNAGDSPFVSGDTFTLFDPLSTVAGSFSAFKLPPLTPGLAWSTSNLVVNGSISVVTGPPSFSGISISGSAIVLNALGTPNGPVTVLTSTNLTLPFTSWTTVTTGNYDNTGKFTYTVSGALSSGKPQQFYTLKE